MTKNRYVVTYAFTRYPYSEKITFMYLDAYSAEGAEQLANEYLAAAQPDAYRILSIQAVEK